MEHLLHYAWKHKIFPIRELKTTDGQRVEVIDPGLHNTDAGPDFFNAKLKINGTLWVGNVEIHSIASDWYRHGHNNDKVYDSVILHVVEVCDAIITRSNGDHIPQLVLRCPEEVKQNYRSLLHADISPACGSILSSLPKLTVHSWISALQVERLEHKTTSIKELLTRVNGDWEACLFCLMARYMGAGLNGDAFQAWAELIPLKAADKIRDDLQRLEALFFGMAGLLDGEPEDSYMEPLSKEFAYLSHLYSLPKPLDKSRWKMFRTRPENFPYIRIAQLAHIYFSQRGIFSRIMEAKNTDTLYELFDCSTSEYWESHYRFGAESGQRRSKPLGRNMKSVLIINVAIPMMYTYGSYRGSDVMCEWAGRLLDDMKPENNYITRMWNDVGIDTESAADTQALIELRREYCEKKKCLFCRFGYEFLRSKKMVHQIY